MSYCLELYERHDTNVYLIFIPGNYVMAALKILYYNILNINHDIIYLPFYNINMVIANVYKSIYK